MLQVPTGIEKPHAMLLQDAAIDIDAGVEAPLLDGAGGASDGSEFFSGWTVPGVWHVLMSCSTLCVCAAGTGDIPTLDKSHILICKMIALEAVISTTILVCVNPINPCESAAGAPVKGWALTRQRLWALLVKRSCCARRDRLAVVTQLAVPILLVVVALWAGKAYVNSPDEPPLAINRCDESTGYKEFEKYHLI